MNGILELLNNIELKKAKDSEKKFNIFCVLGIQYNEVLICRFLGELLNPNGAHGCQALFLDEFFKTVIKKDVENLQNSDVVLEDRTDDNRRVDIAVYTDDEIFPIEVKIWAEDQKSQLSDYWNYYLEHGNVNCIYYLTPNGHLPSNDSLGELRSGEQCRCLSFKENISEWLKNCEPRIKDEFIKNEIKQFMGVIEEMCRSDTDLGIIKDNVFSSEKAKNSALQILRFKDEILEEFRNDFLLNRIDYGDKFKLVFITDNDEKEEYKHLIAKVKSTINEKTVAYICYETNLYMYVPNPDNRVTETNWKVADDEKYGWTYLEFIKNKHINFNKLWENTDPKFWDNTRKIVIANYIK